MSMSAIFSPKFKSYLQRSWMLYAMLLPTLVLFAIFAYYPMYGVVMAFQKFNPGLGFDGSPWVGMANFTRLLNSPIFPRVVTNTLIIAVSKLVTGQAAAILGASIRVFAGEPACLTVRKFAALSNSCR